MNENRRLGRAFTFVISILALAFAGIVGNRADDFFLRIIKAIDDSRSIRVWILILLLIAAALPPTLAALKFYSAHKVSINLIKLDDTLLRLLREFRQTYNGSGRSGIFGGGKLSNREEAIQRLVEELLDKTLDVFYLFQNCAIEMWYPDPTSSDYLTLWGQANSVDTARARQRFYIREKDRLRSGLAGYTFIDREIRVAHISRKNGEWVTDLPEYLFINGRERANRFPYRSLIAVPIIVRRGGQPDSCLGVLCMYSMDTNVFDLVTVQNLLVAIADRIASMCVITRNL